MTDKDTHEEWRLVRKPLCAICGDPATIERINRAGRWIRLCDEMSCLTAEWERDAINRVCGKTWLACQTLETHHHVEAGTS